ncbi:MAG: PaaI family thioesterase, partial [bacterium]|nr:PaaI family thioesterase [bacterium]
RMTTTDRSNAAATPAAKRLGFSATQIETGRISFSGTLDPVHDADPSAVHALTAAMLDDALDRALRSVLAGGVAPAIVELKISYARPYTSANGVMTCEACVVDLGEHVGTAHARVTDEHAEIFVEADATCVIRRT